jgi:hypothetical protein
MLSSCLCVSVSLSPSKFCSSHGTLHRHNASEATPPLYLMISFHQ